MSTMNKSTLKNKWKFAEKVFFLCACILLEEKVFFLYVYTDVHNEQVNPQKKWKFTEILEEKKKEKLDKVHLQRP